MQVSVDHAKSELVLADAMAKAEAADYSIPNDLETKVEQILGHTHLTYKYVLLTGVLAKATNPKANPLVLQAGSALDGAFDARSLCHSVVVPFEQTVLEKRLGGSNEPFLNKPARYPDLSEDNAVRRGRDRETLSRLIALGKQLNDMDDGTDALVAVLYHILRLESRVVQFDEDRFKGIASKRALREFFSRLIANSCEGESLALGIASMFELLIKTQKLDLVVVSHPANQAGASSKELSDVDVFEADGKSPRYCCEAKDKAFTRADIDHAISKVAETGHGSLHFVHGPNANTAEELDAIEQEYEKKGFDLTFFAADDFATGIISLSSPISWEEFGEILNNHLGSMRAKETTISHCRSTLDTVVS